MLFFANCSGDCQESTYAYRYRKCFVIVDEQNSSGRRIDIKGRNGQTGQWDRYYDQGGWYPDVYKFIEVGDTVVKPENVMMFYIHKKDTTLTIPYDCQGKIYE